MTFLTDILLSAPHPFGLILICLMAGFAGWLVPYLFFAWFNYKNPKIALLTGLFSLLLVAQFGEDLVLGKKREEFIAGQVQQLHEDKLFSTVFSHIPGSETTFRELLAQRYPSLQSANEDEKQVLLADIRHHLLQAYFAEFLSSTGNDDLYQYLKLAYSQMAALRKTPELCVQYYLGIPAPEFSRQNQEWMDREEAIKYTVMVKAIRTPHFKEIQNREQVIAGLVASYRDIKWDESELEKSDALMRLEPKEGCDIAMHMFEAFLHMGPDKGPRAYRFVMLEGNKYYRLLPDGN